MAWHGMADLGVHLLLPHHEDEVKLRDLGLSDLLVQGATGVIHLHEEARVVDLLQHLHRGGLVQDGRRELRTNFTS